MTRLSPASQKTDSFSFVFQSSVSARLKAVLKNRPELASTFSMKSVACLFPMVMSPKLASCRVSTTSSWLASLVWINPEKWMDDLSWLLTLRM